MTDKSPERLAAEGLAHRERHAPNCAGCNGYHGSETFRVLCLTRRVRTLEAGPDLAEFARLQRLEARLMTIKADHDRRPMTKGGTAESRRFAGRRKE